MELNDTPVAPLDFELIGYNVRCSRMARNKTQAEVAELACVDRTTVRRLESGSRVQRRSLEKICAVLGRQVSLVNSVMPYGTPDEERRAHVHRKADLAWFAGGDRRKNVPKENQELLQWEEERLRLARLGLVSMFEAYMITLPYGPSVSVAEICGVVSVGPHETYNESIVVCLRGAVVVRAGDEVITVGEGDSVGFSTDKVTTVEPASRIGPEDLPPKIFFVMGNRKGHVPIEFKHAKRKRIRH